MKAVVCTKYGPPDVLQVAEVKKPIPKDDEVLIKIRATAVTASDCIIRGFKLPRWRPLGLMMSLVVGIRAPRQPILGLVLAGDIESVGKDVTRFQVGDPVYAFTELGFGGYAQYTCMPAKEGRKGCLVIKPANISYEEAAAIVYGGVLATHYLKKGNIQRGQKVLVYGASGAIGTTAVQLAKCFGADVTGVCSTANLDMVRSLGAQQVIDYTTTDSLPNNARYDLVLDAVGTWKTSALKKQCKKALTENGKYISVDDGSPPARAEHLELLKEVVEAGQFQAVIDRTYPLEEMVAAHRYVDAGHKKGNVVITVAHADE